MTPRLLLALALGAALAPGCKQAPRADVQAENAAREAFARDVAIDAGAGRSLDVASRADVLFEEGFSMIAYDPPDDFHNAAFRWMGQRGHVRVHGHGDKAMRLTITGWVNEKVIRSKPVLTVYLDGLRVADTGAIENGVWGVETVVPSALLRDAGWLDVLLTVSTVAFHWGEPPDLRVVVVGSVRWTEAP